MAEIALVRIDSRLVHGQVTTKWLRTVQANRIVIIDDALARDPFLKKVYTMAAPPGTVVDVLDVSSALDGWRENAFGAGRALVLFKDVRAAYLSWTGGFECTHLQVGGLGGGPGRKTVYKNITLSVEDAALLGEMAKGGVCIEFQTIPEDNPAGLEGIAQKMNLRMPGKE